MHIQIRDILVNVQLVKTTGEDILNKIGITQGDYLSALLFIFYQAKTIQQLPDQMKEQDHQHQSSFPYSLTDISSS